jgi:type IV pilus assembly protein PilB
MNVSTAQLKSFIFDTGLVSQKDLEAAEKEAATKNQPFGDVLVSQGKIKEDDLRKVEAHLLGIPFVDLKGQKIEYAVLSVVPEPVARKHNIVSYKRSGNDLEVAMLDPEDLEAIEFVKKSAGLRILPRLSDLESIKGALAQYQQSLSAEFNDLIKQDAANISAVQEKTGEDLEAGELKKMAEDLPIVRIVDSLLSHAIVQKASDIHIEPFEKEVFIRYRIDGILHDAMTLPKNVAPGIAARIKVLANLRLDEKRLPQDGRFKIETPEQKVAFRVSTLPTYFGEKIVMRLLPESVRGFTLEALGFHGQGLEYVHNAMRQTVGMILTTGPTGSGKTTTLYTVIDILNKPEVNISTIEDPVEYQMMRVNQTQVKPEIGLTFSSGLRTLVRQDPDIVMVGEIRDGETVNLAINAALTGHLVLSTLHTNSAAGAMPRMTEMGAEAFLIVSTVKVIIAQRLVRRLSKIKEPYTLSKDEQTRLAAHVRLDYVLEILRKEGVVPADATWDTITLYRPKPSDEAPDGYQGRLGIHEVLPMTRTIKDLVIKGATADEIEDQAKKEGMITMIEDGIYKAAQGITSVEEVYRVISE